MSRRPVAAVVDLDAVAANVAALVEAVRPAAVCAVVKADGYGHGAVPVARTALAAGARWLAVALPAEGATLRSAGIDAPVLLLSEPGPDEFDDVVAARLRPTLYTQRAVEETAKAVARAAAPPLPVHVKVDTGMHRVGAPPARVAELVAAVAERPELVLEGLWTHCAVADEPGNPFTATQLDRFDEVAGALEAAAARPPVVHAANSAAALDHPRARHDLVRCGITVYGLDPSAELAGRVRLQPAMSLVAEISAVRVVKAGEAVSYGLRRPVAVDSVVATVPLGYADGVPRRLSSVGGEVLVGGRRRPLAGTVTMDQLMVDCGPLGDPAADAVRAGDEVVLLGRQGEEGIGAAEWAERLDTISYEIVCGISARVPRRYVGGPSGDPA
ncbi:MAG TPA: alanine racemase [Acidimicrobiales bacterium]|jgi:alanine racemase|nr:alanine racemase [Acidimicrobiales bacterium]